MLAWFAQNDILGRWAVSMDNICEQWLYIMTFDSSVTGAVLVSIEHYFYSQLAFITQTLGPSRKFNDVQYYL
jgi:hypothetical protein